MNVVRTQISKGRKLADWKLVGQRLRGGLFGARTCVTGASMSPEARIRVLREAPPDGWVAFSAAESRLIAYGTTYEEAVAKSEESGEPDPVLVKLPKDWSMQVL